MKLELGRPAGDGELPPGSLGTEKEGSGLWAALALATLAALLAAFMATVFIWGIRSATGKVAGAEYYAASFASLLPFGYAFAAGMVASVNPCGFLMLPVLIGQYLGQAEPGGGTPGFTFRHLLKATVMGGMATLGFVVLFSAIGLVIVSGGRAIVEAFPWAGFSIGVGLTLLGLWLLLTGRSVGLAWASRLAPPQGRGLGSMFLFGVAYGVASLACTLPVFLVVVGTSLATRGVLPSLVQFISYGLGMGVVFMAVSLGAASLKGAVAQALRGFVPYVHRLSAIFLIGAGAYLLVYWVVLGGLF